MNKITVYKFRVYDVTTDGFHTSSRYGTREAIEKMVRGEVLENTAIDVDESEIESPASDILGLTKREFYLSPHKDFQREILR
jgi:hypothetical protein